MLSAMKFCNKGSTPPPTTIIIKIPEAAAEYFPSPSVARLKMLDHMTDVHKPHSTNKAAATGTVTIWKVEPVNTGMSTATDLPRSIAARIRSIPKVDVAIIMVLLDILSAIKPAVKRPTSISNQ